MRALEEEEMLTVYLVGLGQSWYEVHTRRERLLPMTTHAHARAFIEGYRAGNPEARAETLSVSGGPEGARKALEALSAVPLQTTICPHKTWLLSPDGTRSCGLCGQYLAPDEAPGTAAGRHEHTPGELISTGPPISRLCRGCGERYEC
jgi:hypothetical protein